MRRLLKFLGWGFAGIVLLAGVLFAFRQPLLARLGVSLPAGDAEVTEISLPDGFSTTVFAEGLSTPRFMAVGPEGTVFLTELGTNRVLALPYSGRGEQTNEKVVIAEDLDRPASLAFRPGTSELYMGLLAQRPKRYISNFPLLLHCVGKGDNP